MTKEKTNKNNGVIFPVSAQIVDAKGELSIGILKIQDKYRLPSYLMDLLITSILAEIRSCSHQDDLTAIKIENEKPNEEEK